MKDGEPVFPPISVEKEIVSETYPVINIRDYFAIRVIQSFIVTHKALDDVTTICEDAYRFADAMIKERERKI